MRGNRLLVALVTVALAVPAAVLTPGLVGAQDADVSISSVNVAPSDPAPGEPFTITTNVSNLASTDGPVDVTAVYVRGQGDGVDEYGRVSSVGSISSGSSLSVPLSATIDGTGTKNLRVTVRVQTDDGEYQNLEYPLTVTVEESNDVLVSIPTTSAPVDDGTPVNVTVANGASGPISGVELTMDGDATIENPRRIAASIDPGTERHFEYDVTFEEPGTRTIDATVSYSTDDDVTRTVTQTRAVAVGNDTDSDGIQGEVRLTGVDASGSGIVTLQGDAANVGGTNVESVLLSVEETDGVSPMGSNGEYFVGAVNASQFDTFELIAQVDDGVETVPVQIEYIANGAHQTDRVDVDVSGDGGDPGMGVGNEREPGPERTPPADHEPRSTGVLGTGVPLVPLLVVVGLAGTGLVVWKRR